MSIENKNKYYTRIFLDNPLNSKQTLNEYVKIIKRLYKHFNGTDNITSLKIFSDIDGMFEYIDKFNKKYRQVVYSAIIKFLRSYPSYKPYLKYYINKLATLMTEIDNEKNTDNEKTIREKNNWLSWDEILLKRDDIVNDAQKYIRNIRPDTINTDYNDILLYATIISLYTYIPPRRNSDYVLLKLLRQSPDNYNQLDKEYNYFDIEKHMFIFYNYKTVRKSGIQIIDVPDSLYDILMNYITYYKHFDNDVFLFSPDHNGENHYASSWMTHALNNIFYPNKIGSSMLRHIYLSHTEGDTYKRLHSTASAMAHTINTQKTYIRK